MEKLTSRMLLNMDLNNPTEKEIHTLYNYAYITAIKHIHFLNKIKGQVEGKACFAESVKDEAQICMSRLFTPVKETGKILILEMLNKARMAHLHDNIDISEYLKHFVRGSVKRNRQNMMRYQQPQEYRMLRAIKGAVQSSQYYEIRRKGSTSFIAEIGRNIDQLNVLTKVELAELCKSVFSNNTSVYKLATLALTKLHISSLKNPCLRLDHFLQIILEHLSSFYEIEQQLKSNSDSAELHLISETAILEPTYAYIDSIIDQQYLNKGKIDTRTCLNLKAILRQYLKDLFTTSSTDTLRSYISACCNDQNTDAFIREHQHKLYYLINLQKQHLEMLARKLLGEDELATADSAQSEPIKRQA